ncbi:hypothetical protein ACIBEJ_35270 [Nonomuraea sp. NPDC050790]|uniref:hypothetical protein n=1 Tax=Nonomuraea sp. NPDC050790 TaxID=3364371 RepID=UPI00379EAD14
MTARREPQPQPRYHGICEGCHEHVEIYHADDGPTTIGWDRYGHRVVLKKIE